MAGYLAGNVDEWIYIDIADQHPDSMRFIHDCEKAIGKQVTVLRSTKYKSVEDCIMTFGWIRNIHNHFYPCTNRLKKEVRKIWEEQHHDYELTYIWGIDFSEKARAERIVESNPQAEHVFPLIEKQLTKHEVHGLFEMSFDFKRPLMYDLGYPNNNCIGCVKGGMGYWNKIRVDFPEVFERRAKMERTIGNTIFKGMYLDELDPARGNMNTEIFPDCGIMCYLAQEEQEMKNARKEKR